MRCSVVQLIRSTTRLTFIQHQKKSLANQTRTFSLFTPNTRTFQTKIMQIPEDPNTAESLVVLNKHFGNFSYLGNTKSDEDRVLFSRLTTSPCSQAYPHLARWFYHMTVQCGNSAASSDAVSKGQPTWNCPEQKTAQLKIWNSLTRRKDDFIPSNGKNVTWYNCGPTVYDASHMGHARSYITFDILRRIMSDYFGFNILYVMNITDIDDKIIYRARTKFLLDRYRSEMGARDKNEVLSEIKESVEDFKVKMSGLTPEDPKLKMMQKVMDKLSPVLAKPDADVGELLTLASMAMETWLDTRLGADVTDHSIFAALTQHWETEFHKDLKELNVLPTDVLTRVTDYVPEIVDYVQKIIDNGYAYASNGSVYFDSAAWRRDRGYLAKLKPESVGDLDALAEGEGKFSDVNSKEKKNQVDFALWKSSKPGEPFWESPWGQGRPGWHIECSAMADSICNNQLDIHSGGEDLLFPHHDNEILQAEGYSNSKQWVNYFIHAGHLSIEGCKMSKSLKNFITIKDALKKNTGRQLRIHFLSHSWHGGLDYSESAMSEAVTTEKYFNDFFLLVKYHKSSLGEGISSFTKLTPLELKLYQQLQECQKVVHNALADSFDTPTAMRVLKSVVSDSYTYLSAQKDAPNVRLLIQVAVYITKILSVFGVAGSQDNIGFASAGEGSVSTDEVALPFVKALSEFRDEVRGSARELKAFDILKKCDNLRDNVLPELGVRLEDRELGDPAVFKIDDKETLLREKKQRQDEIVRKEKEKAERAAARDKAAKEKLEKGKVPPLEMFRTAQYSAWDDQGFPTHDAKGVEVPKSQQKKLKKLQAAQEKLHKTYLQHISDLEI
ncbi:cysteine--tRNA ligase, cytoplasmic-like isoform X1 [Bolinopsis microptera]|uniref:cysteine--tRNA ligase, cytoplasmic-like isoform X1 n=1 Tax=Bolinopsis microptera TaxID=2820187 RepID=UPI003078D65B